MYLRRFVRFSFSSMLAPDTVLGNEEKHLFSYKIINLILVTNYMFVGPLWWSSGQRARLLLRRSEFNSRCSLQFFCKIVVEKN